MPSFHRSPATIRSLRFRVLSPFEVAVYQSNDTDTPNGAA
jgi:hypothetical protein